MNWDSILELRSLRSVEFRHQEQLEFILASELEKRLEQLPLGRCSQTDEVEIVFRELVDLSISLIIPEAAIGEMSVRFIVAPQVLGEESVFWTVRLPFEFFRIDGLLRFRFSGASISGAGRADLEA